MACLYASKSTTMSPGTRQRSNPPMSLILIFALAQLALPFSVPFAAGTHAAITSSINSPSNLRRTLQVSSTSARFAASVTDVDGSLAKGIGSQVSSVGTTTTPDDSQEWKGGEATASLFSRLFFQYASPLLQIASKRRLTVEDSMEVPESRRMDKAVTSLSRIYYNYLRRKQQGAIEGIKSESIILTHALFLHQRRMLVWTAFLRLLNTAVQAFPALLVARLLRLVEAGDAHSPVQALSAAVALLVVLFVKMMLENQFFHNVVKYSTQVRGALAGLVFDKSLRLPGGGTSIARSSDSGEEGSLGVGGVLNLMQSDASIIESAALQIHTIWDAPLQLTMYTTLLYRYLGPSVFWGIGVLLMTIPINSLTLRLLNKLSKIENEAKDARTKRTAESINNMKLLKLNCWEEQFADDIRKWRSEEMRLHVGRGIIRALNTAFSNAVPALVLVVTLSAYVKSGKPLVASTIFTSISLFNQLRYPLFFYPMLVDALANGRNSMRRIASYLSTEEIAPYVHTIPATIDSGGSIEMHMGNFLWSSAKNSSAETSTAPALIDANIKVNAGEIVAVVGGVGSGKSTLIKGLLGELNPAPRTIVHQAISSSLLDSVNETINFADKASVTTRGNVAYCSQEAWLPKGTIRDAVVFGREYDEARYFAAIRDAGLDEDISDKLPGTITVEVEGRLSHDTNVGEGGSALSGGQRARVALARALYSGDDTKVFLLDDCLAALDASVGSTVFDRLSKRLRGSKAAAVLVTNDPSIPRRCDRVILMGKVPSSTSCSTIIDVGTYDDLISRGHDLRHSVSIAEETVSKIEEDGKEFMVESSHDPESHYIESKNLMKVAKKAIGIVGGYEGPENCTEGSCHADPECQVGMENCPDYMANHQIPNSPDIVDVEGIFQLSNSTVVTFGDQATAMVAQADAVSQESALVPEKIASADEAMSAGAVPWSTYVSYFKSVRRPLLIAAMVGSYLMANGAQFFQQYTIAKWTEVGHGSGIGAAVGAKYMRSLVNAAGVVSIFLWLRSFLTMVVGVRASKFLHKRMLSSVFAAPMAFFDATSSGQLLSRFGKEMETVDRLVPDSIGSVLFCFLQIFMSIGALMGVVTPGMLVPIALVSVLYVKAMSLFRPAARDMKRAETKSRSPIYTHFGEALRGTETIRSIPGASKTWSLTHRNLSDTNLAVFYTVKSFDRWLSARLEMLGNTVVFTAAVASVFLTRMGRLKAGSAGWGLTQALAITGLLTWAVRCLTDLETNMMSVMRIKELTDLDREEPDLSSLRSEARMPKEPSNADEALRPLFSNGSSFNTTLAPLDNSAALAKDGWPWQGNVQFRNVSMRYSPTTPLVLDRVTLSVPAGTTLGVVGRTGSGKSSLLLTLFRLVEIEAGGRIDIDAVDIRSVSLKTLRQSLAIIPQDPVLFAGTVAYNLDATGKASSEEMWSALEAASPILAQQFRDSEGLDSKIIESGRNLSLGQRQLICLARALLRKSKILVLDEATSSVDAKTDQEVQQTIRREFVEKGVTVITVAHRLDTVLGYDKIAVLGNGRVVEYGSPNELLRISGGELRQLVEADRQSKRKGAIQKQDEALVSA